MRCCLFDIRAAVDHRAGIRVLCARFTYLISTMRFATVIVCLASTLLAACSNSVLPGAATSAVRLPAPLSLSLSEDDFRSEESQHRKVDVQLQVGQQLQVILGSNPTTGYTWTREADVGDSSVLLQLGHEFVAPKVPAPGAGGKESWVLKAVKPGTTTVRLGYGRSWVQGDLARSLMINVQVKP
ncbi:MAG: hypothetical protein RLY71_1012 [Pseudomonadota bacterium]